MIEDLLKINQEFVESGKYETFISTKYPNKKIAILSCMDTRLTELLPAAFGFKNGDVQIIKNAGAVISSPFGSVMRSLIVAIYILEVEDILVVGHYDCGLLNLNDHDIISKMKEKGIQEDTLKTIENCGIELNVWLKGFDSVEKSICSTVDTIKNHPLIPKNVHVYGLVMDPNTGKSELLT